jgi:uncharacterized protein (DUF2062 family)
MDEHPQEPLPPEEDLKRQSRFARIRRLKKWLRPLPRKGNLHRYPFLKYFAEFARKRTYLWSIRPAQVIPALYAGSIITVMPLQGVQIPLSFLSGLLLKCNLPILIALQFLSNAFTLPPIYAADYYIGHWVLQYFMGKKEVDDFKVQELANQLEEAIELPTRDGSIWQWVIDSLNSALDLLMEKGPYYLGAASLGGLILGLLLGLILHLVYRIWVHSDASE